MCRSRRLLRFDCAIQKYLSWMYVVSSLCFKTGICSDHVNNDTCQTTYGCQQPSKITQEFYEAHRPHACYVNNFWQYNHLDGLDMTLNSQSGDDDSDCHDFQHIYLTQAVADILHRMDMESAMIIYTEHFSSQVDSLMIRAQVNWYYYLKFTTWEVGLNGQGSTPDDILSTVNGYDYVPAIILLTDSTTARKLVKVGRSRNLISTDWTWVVTSPVAGGDWQEYMEFGDKVIFIDYSHLDGEREEKGTQSGTACNKTSNQLQLSYKLWDFAMTTETMRMFGTWTLNSSVPYDIGNLWEFQRFENKTFNITSINLPIFHFYDEQTQTWKGICIEILETLAAALNFNYTITLSVDSKWGAPVGNDTWNGMVGMVYRKEVDWGLAKFTVTSIRDQVIDYATPFWHEPAVIVMKKPEGESMFVYFGPFRWELWFALSVTVPFMGFFVALTVQLGHDNRKKHPFYKQVYLSSWVCFGAMVQQGSKWNPISQSARLMVGFYWFFSIVAAATYTGNLIAVLAVPKTILPVLNLEDLANQNKYSYGSMNGAAIYTLIEMSSFDLYQTLWNKEMQYTDNNVANHQEGLEKVKLENYIYLGEKAGVAPVVYEDCDYAIGKEEFFPSSMALIFPEKSPLIPIVNKKITNMIEAGMIERWKRQYHPIDKCSSQSPGSGEPATIREAQGGFVLLCGCVSLAGLLVLLEYLYHCGKLDRFIPWAKLKSTNFILTI